MSDGETILRIAAKGDGVTATGRHVAGGVPGDIVGPDGLLTPGPHRATPPCRHFGKCGGCQLQHADEEALRRFVTERVVFAAESQDVAIGELLPTHLSPPRSRRRATLHAMQTGGRGIIGFREARSHRIVDLRECHILEEALFALVDPLRQIIGELCGRSPADIELTRVDQGVDCTIRGIEKEGLSATEALLDFARGHDLARLSLDTGFGAETIWEPHPVTVTLAGIAVPFPPGSFLQPTQDGEHRLAEDARAFVGDATAIAELFSGLGTFAFALARPAKVLAVEASRDAHLACKAAANAHSLTPVHALHRDLFRNPLQADELARFDAVLLDPPRAGAREQIAAIADSRVDRLVYISCNPASWAKDARTLAGKGFRLAALRPVGQFRWSTHVELASYFLR